MTLEGLDVSHWQGRDLPNGTREAVTPDLTGKSFGFAKVSEGTLADDCYTGHMAHFQAANLVTGGYCFGRSDVAIVTQVAFFVSHAIGAQILVLDNEGGHILSLSQARAFISAVRVRDPLKRAILLYQSASKFPFDAGQDADWIADYRTGYTHTKPGTFWQYTSTPYDKDRWNGTLAELQALAHLPIAPDTSTGGTVPPLPITDTTPHYVDIAGPATFYKLDGTIESAGHGAQTNKYSPFIAMNGTSSFYAIYADPGQPSARLILTKPSAVRPVPPPDCSSVQNKLDDATALATNYHDRLVKINGLSAV